MAFRPCYSVDEALSAVLGDLDLEFRGGDTAEEPLANENEDAARDSDSEAVGVGEGDSEPHYLDVTCSTESAASAYFDEEAEAPDAEAPVAAADGIGAELAAVPKHCCDKKCLEKLDAGGVTQIQLSVAEMTRDEKDLFVLGLLESSQYSADVTTKGKKRSKSWYKYSCFGMDVCVTAFRTVYSIGTKQLENLRKHLNQHGPVPRVHKNRGKKPKHALMFPMVQDAVTFLKAYAERFGIPHPAPLHGRTGTPPAYLHAGCTMLSIHKEYVTSCQEAERAVVGYDSFRGIWHQCLPHIKIMTPRTDVCEKCEDYRRQVVAAVSEAAKVNACEALTAHVHGAQVERDNYRAKTVEARQELDALGDELRMPPCAPCSQALACVHYTFDFAQNVGLPQSARQEGPMYYKVPRKIQIFGVNNEAVPRQVNYLLDENDTIGADGKHCHGPNTVASLLHHFFEVHGLGELECYLHADNCGGQNKNKTIVAYLAWRVMCGLHQKITISFMITGHTRCLVDGCFGLLKKKFRASDCYTLQQLAELVDSSAECNVSQLYPGSSVEWRSWDSFLPRFFKPIKGIQKLHHLVFDAAKPGVVSVKKLLGDPEEDVQVLSSSVDAVRAAGLPDVIPPGGLSLQRQTYLYQQVRPHVPDQFKDDLCPQPLAEH